MYLMIFILLYLSPTFAEQFAIWGFGIDWEVIDDVNDAVDRWNSAHADKYILHHYCDFSKEMKYLIWIWHEEELHIILGGD
jgi:hypothetical protein